MKGAIYNSGTCPSIDMFMLFIEEMSQERWTTLVTALLSLEKVLQCKLSFRLLVLAFFFFSQSMPPDVFLQLYNWAKFPNHRHVFAKHTVLLILVFNGLSYVFRQSLTLNSSDRQLAHYCISVFSVISTSCGGNEYDIELQLHLPCFY